MIKKLLFTLFLASGLILNAQDKTKEEVLQLVAEDTCECISKKENFDGKTPKQKQMALGLCMINSLNERKKGSTYFEENPVDDFEAFGEQVGMFLLGMCSENFLNVFSEEELINYAEETYDEKSTESNKITYSNTNTLKLNATLIAMENNTISSLNMEDDFGKTHNFIIINDFSGSELLKKSNFKKNFVIEYYELDVYDLSEKRYVKKKVLKSLKMI
ncbi:hypothetical protein ACFQ1Q_01360 [Winogradskyella litorisediminis]|uniref:Tissue inhibitor of metalloproteinase n=1 Tax=Winogradskyella litorisediminis TaxID=1156618 RepID=A0ABW3N2W8_9FLAO